MFRAAVVTLTQHTLRLRLHIRHMAATTTMQAIQISATGGSDVLQLNTVAVPTAGAGQVLVKNKAIGVNFIDTYHRTGLYPLPLPATLGREAAGEVAAVGEGVTAYKVGDRVAHVGAAGGSYAEYTVVPITALAHVPADVDLESAAALMLQGLTAQYLTRSTFRVKKGDNVLVHAGAGGTGQLLIQVCKYLGARVLTTVSSEEKATVAKAAGADDVIIYTAVDFATEVRRLTSDKGVQVVYDGVGKTTFDGSLKSLARRGMLVSFGNASGAVDSFSPLLLSKLGSLFLTRPTLFDHIAEPGELEERTKELFEWVEKGVVSALISARFALKVLLQKLM
eukprot:TRINITY_DN5650_c0_g6_i1.p1 TRINITY_DN5650_c0_g6~~TRINITY_DN5650_c0_g6_i1.p1  ORF type:complete len:337 (+),score=105.28 TRINITY_DN5650_c0_g6_i1:14-1024(+)